MPNVPINSWYPSRRIEFVESEQRHAAFDLVEDDFWEIVRNVWEYTLLNAFALYNLYQSIKYVLKHGIEGDFVECGVFFGGSIMFFVEMMRRYDRFGQSRVFGLDNFYGFVRRSDRDVDYQGNWVCFPNDPKYSFRQAAETNVASVIFDPQRVQLVVGDVIDTFPTLPVERIAILRLDTDTYDTTKFELETGWSKLSKGGVVIIDDYGWCKGSRDATDEFFADKPVLLHRINSWVRCAMKA
jgi:O-methyltransferase